MSAIACATFCCPGEFDYKYNSKVVRVTKYASIGLMLAGIILAAGGGLGMKAAGFPLATRFLPFGVGVGLLGLGVGVAVVNNKSAVVNFTKKDPEDKQKRTTQLIQAVKQDRTCRVAWLLLIGADPYKQDTDSKNSYYYSTNKSPATRKWLERFSA